MRWKNQKEFWDKLGESNPDAAVIDPSDKLGHKNKYIVSVRNKAIFNEIKKFNENIIVLDFGCGSGLTSEYLSRKKIQPIGVDISYKLLTRARSRLINEKLNVVQYDGVNLPFKIASFDCLVTYVVLNHITNRNNLVCVLNELKKVLKDNGVIIAIEQTRRRNKFSRDKTKKQLTMTEFEKIFENSDFRVVKKKVLRYGHFPFIYLIRFGLIKENWYKNIASLEELIGAFYKVPLLDYVDTLFVLKKSH